VSEQTGIEGISGRYRCILMDPPWDERGGGKCCRGAQRHYQVAGVEDIRRSILASPEWRPCADAHLWMWATSNHLPDALWLIDALGFRYVTSAAWVKMRAGKLQIGLGQYMRHAHELLLLATRGSLPVPPPERRMPSVILAERTAHSRKPATQYALIEAVSPGPRLEMFARRAWPGWDHHGDGAPDDPVDLRLPGR